MRDNHLCPLNVNENRPRSISPLGISRCREFITDLSRRFSRRSHDGVICMSENNTEFASDPPSTRLSRKDLYNSNLEIDRISRDVSCLDDWENANPPHTHRSFSAARSALPEFRLSLKPSSQKPNPVTGSDASRKDQPTQKKILRQPVSYTYLKGMSGLPTQRVPRSIVCSQYSCRRRFLV